MTRIAGLLISILAMSGTLGSFSHARNIDCDGLIADLFLNDGKFWHQTRDGQKVFSHYSPPKDGKNSIYVLVNGLVYSTDRWDQLAKELTEKGHGVLRYDFINQSKTLAQQKQVIHRSLADQAEDLKELITKVKGEKSEIHLVGLSYGAAITTEFAKKHPKELSSLTLMSPIVVSTDRYQAAGNLARNSLEFYRLWNPIIYETAYETTYRNLIRSLYQQSRYPDVSVSSYQDALFELGKAVRDFDLKKEIHSIRDVPIKLILAGEEEAAARADILKVKEALDQRSGEKSGFFLINDASHAVPDSAPKDAAKILVNKNTYSR